MAFLGSAYVADYTADIVNDVTVNRTSAQMTTQYGGGNLLTPSADFSHVVNGVLVTYRNGVPVRKDANVAAILTGRPIS